MIGADFPVLKVRDWRVLWVNPLVINSPFINTKLALVYIRSSFLLPVAARGD